MPRTPTGFGDDPHDRQLHFRVTITRPGAPVLISEHVSADDPGTMRLEAPWFVWERIAGPFTDVINARITAAGLRPGRFRVRGTTPLEWLAGKELLVLLWAIEHITAPTPAQLDAIDRAIANWRGWHPEIRWFFYTETNAACGGPDARGHGWRAALRHILVENPTSHLDIALRQAAAGLGADAPLTDLPWRDRRADDPGAALYGMQTSRVASIASGEATLWVAAEVMPHHTEARALIGVNVGVWAGPYRLAERATAFAWHTYHESTRDAILTGLARPLLGAVLAQARAIASLGPHVLLLDAQLAQLAAARPAGRR